VGGHALLAASAAAVGAAGWRHKIVPAPVEATALIGTVAATVVAFAEMTGQWFTGLGQDSNIHSRPAT
jgi:predicted alpha/beta hydrolase